MPHLPTLGLLSVTDGRLMGNMDEVHQVIGFFVGGFSFSHDLAANGRLAAVKIVNQFEGFVFTADRDMDEVRAEALARYGTTLDVPEEWRGCLAGVVADDR